MESSRAQAEALLAEVSALPEVKSAVLVTREEWFVQVEAQQESEPEDRPYLPDRHPLTAEDLFDKVEVVLNAGEDDASFAAQFAGRPEITEAVYNSWIPDALVEGSTFRASVQGVASDPYTLLDRTEALLVDATDVDLYLNTSASRAQSEALLAEVSAMPEVVSAALVTKEEALELMREELAANPEIFEDLSSNPFPDTIRIILAGGVDEEAFRVWLEAKPEVDAVMTSNPQVVYPGFPTPDFELLRGMIYGAEYLDAKYLSL
jgi:hypothetical protein